MGCNGYNHGPHCTCGWGGEYHGVSEGAQDRRFYWQQYSSYTNPNATCPGCGQRVFFYQSPYGGRVYFDDLGPPWPKHTCTDDSMIASATGPSDSKPRRLLPLYCLAVRRNGVDPKITEIHHRAGVVEETVYANIGDAIIDCCAPYFYEVLPGGDYFISTLNMRGSPLLEVEFTATKRQPTVENPPPLERRILLVRKALRIQNAQDEGSRDLPDSNDGGTGS